MVLAGAVAASLVGCGGAEDADDVDVDDAEVDDAEVGDAEVGDDTAGSDTATADGASDGDDDEPDAEVEDPEEREPGTSADGAVLAAADSRELTWEVTYRSAEDTEVVVANRDAEVVATRDGEVVARVTPDGPMSCDGGDCQLLLMDAGAPLGQVLRGELGPAAVGFDLGEIVAVDPAIEPSGATIADRPATCLTVPVAAIGVSGGEGLDGDEDIEVCVDDETGAVLRSRLDEGAWLEATAFTTTPQAFDVDDRGSA